MVLPENVGKTKQLAVHLLRSMPRVSLNNLKDMAASKKAKRHQIRSRAEKKLPRIERGAFPHGKLPPLGYDGQRVPFYQKQPVENYYKALHVRRQYPPFSLHQLQRTIELGWLDPDQPIDLAAICRTPFYSFDPKLMHYGLNLTEDGADVFSYRLNLEVQWASQVTIAAVERNGGVIRTRYFDPISLNWIRHPYRMFKLGQPIPKCQMPPRDALTYYMNAKNRGYLADAGAIQQAKLELAQQFGYQLANNLDHEDDHHHWAAVGHLVKDPRQIFFGLEPGWLVDLLGQRVIKPKLQQFTNYLLQ